MHRQIWRVTNEAVEKVVNTAPENDSHAFGFIVNVTRFVVWLSIR